MTAAIVKYWHTLLYLKPAQISARARLVLFKPRLPDWSDLPAPTVRNTRSALVPGISRRPSMTDPGSFVFLNEPGRIATPGDWNNPTKAKLWLYNLHYFDDLNAAGAERRSDWHRALIARWIEENLPGSGNGWEPYPLSLRIVNWVKWALAGNALDARALASLQHQAHALARGIEWHLLGNHLLANAKALIFAGLFFSGPAAENFLAQGMAIYRDQLDEQVLDDGGHFELSPMYHALLLEDVLDLINLDQAYGHAFESSLTMKLRDVADAMRSWLGAMTHPDGEIAFFNDCAFGVAGSPVALEAYAVRLNLGVAPTGRVAESDQSGLTHMAASGYVRLEKPGVVALVDCAAIGPDYLPGHAHADTLSFELSLGEERVIVNGGTSVYGTGTDRLRQRSTAAHSTVEIDGQNSSEVWGGFRVARRARVTEVKTKVQPEFEVVASHDGYRRLQGRNMHSRTFRLDEGRFEIADAVSGPYRSAIARFHLAPGASLDIEPDGRRGRIATRSGRSLRWTSLSPAAAEPSRWHPEFGLTTETQCLVVRLGDGTSRLTLEW